MATTILEKLQKLEGIVTNDNVNGNPNANPPTPPGALGKALSNTAVAAITGGIISDAWKAYMSLFADNAAQLERLTVENPTDADYLPLLRAYMVSNAVCDIQTNTKTANRVDERIDLGLVVAPQDPPDDAVVKLRPFVIPGL
jgi:hypothetical protein